MCLAIPTQVVELQGETMARVRVGNSDTFLSASTMLLPEPPKVGDYLIVHAGFAMHALSGEEALSSLEAFREIAEALENEKTAK
ncbi:MAG: HypC/HybG/HupF family hydrogenase formation chaperone [Desulfovibrio sp.]|jgi:hydrogenase expression/formation protein HypC|nr:HypC/HybG/HupF family hydrogenase formation chaperone [Desulfovibrio sp.]